MSMIPDARDTTAGLAQSTFRLVLDALARPGTIQHLPSRPSLAGMAAEHRYVLGVLVMMLDHEVSFAVEPGPDADLLREAIRRRTRADEAIRENAEVVVATLATLDPNLPREIRRGNLHYPDDAATLVLAVPSLDQAAHDDRRVTLDGPGIAGALDVALPTIPDAFFHARALANAQYPMGIDILLVDAAGRLIGLPRTTRVAIRAMKSEAA